MKPILFNTEMVNAILSGRKTVTRRVVKDPYYIEDEEVSRASGLAIHKGTNTTHGMPYPDSPYRSGDILYVRETWSTKLSCSCKMDETSVCPYESCENPSIYPHAERGSADLPAGDFGEGGAPARY